MKMKEDQSIQENQTSQETKTADQKDQKDIQEKQDQFCDKANEIATQLGDLVDKTGIEDVGVIFLAVTKDKTLRSYFGRGDRLLEGLVSFAQDPKAKKLFMHAAMLSSMMSKGGN
jgi:hypothetical protein